MDHNKESPHLPTLKWSINLQQKTQENTNEEKTISSINGFGEIGCLIAKESKWITFSHNIYIIFLYIYIMCKLNID